jgi:hypothetical protein
MVHGGDANSKTLVCAQQPCGHQHSINKGLSSDGRCYPLEQVLLALGGKLRRFLLSVGLAVSAEDRPHCHVCKQAIASAKVLLDGQSNLLV